MLDKVVIESVKDEPQDQQIPYRSSSFGLFPLLDVLWLV